MLIKVQHAEIVGIVVVVAIGLLWSNRRDVQLGPRGQRGNEVGRSYPALRGWTAQSGSPVDERGSSPGAKGSRHVTSSRVDPAYSGKARPEYHLPPKSEDPNSRAACRVARWYVYMGS
jgi:hypothetical protein